jgi:hypothetical protein
MSSYLDVRTSLCVLFILPYSGEFSWGPIFADNCDYLWKLDPRNKYDCTVDNGHDGSHPRKLNHENFKDWPLEPTKISNYTVYYLLPYYYNDTNYLVCIPNSLPTRYLPKSGLIRQRLILIYKLFGCSSDLPRCLCWLCEVSWDSRTPCSLQADQLPSCPTTTTTE